MGSILSGIGAIFSGGVTGLLGIVLQRFADYKNKQLDLQLEKQRGELELAKLDKEAQIRTMEANAKVEIANVEASAAKDVAASGAFAKSFDMEPAMYSGKAPTGKAGVFGYIILVIVDAIRGSVRPFLTLYLCVIATYLYIEAHDLLGDKKYYTPDQALGLITGIIDTILYLWVTCTTWWFGTRNQQPAPEPIRTSKHG